jgi:hypothetical protein
MDGTNHVDEYATLPSIWINVTSQLEFPWRDGTITWMNMQPYHPFESTWLHNLNFHEWTEQIMWMNMQPYRTFESMWLHNFNFHEWTEWMIWMNVTPPYTYELKANGWIEFDWIRTTIGNGEDLLTKNPFQQPKLQIGCSLICSKPTAKDKIQRIGDITLEIKQT